MANSQGAVKSAMKEKSNYPQGKSGSKVKEIRGPAGHALPGNPTKSGGIYRPTKSN